MALDSAVREITNTKPSVARVDEGRDAVLAALRRRRLHMTQANRKTNVFLFIYAISVVVFSLVFLELFLRFIYAPESVKVRIYMNKLAGAPTNFQKSFDQDNFKFFPNSIGEMAHPEYTIPVSHDFFGFRNPCLPSSRNTGYTLLVGDSYVYGLGVDDDNTFSCHLNKNRGAKFYTMGIPGASPPDYLRMLKTHTMTLEKSISIDKTKPVFVMLFLGNDFESLLSMTDQAESTKGQLEPQQPSAKSKIIGHLSEIILRLNDIVSLGVLSKSYLAQSVKLSLLKLKSFGKYDEQRGYHINYAGSTFYSKNVPLKIAEARSALSYFAKETSRLGYGATSFILMPDPSEVDRIRLKRDAAIGQFDPDQINTSFKFDSIDKACSDLQIYCLDVRPALESSSQSQMNPNFYISDGHLNAQGVSNVSNYIISALKDKSMLGPSERPRISTQGR